MTKHDHLIIIDDADKTLSIYRVASNGEKTLYTSIELPVISNIDNEIDKFKEFAAMLGENILFDSPVVRQYYKI